MTELFTVLHVCTGNICRSPMAEHLMREGLRARLGRDAGRFVVCGAGTWGHAGAPMQPFALAALAARGIDGSAFCARELVADHVRTADLVLAATREHRAAAVMLLPRAAGRTFTVREFARLVEPVDPASLPANDVVERARALVRAAARRRGLVPPADPVDDDVTDPFQGPQEDFGACADLLAAALQGPLDLLAGAGVAPGAAQRPEGCS